MPLHPKPTYRWILLPALLLLALAMILPSCDEIAALRQSDIDKIKLSKEADSLLAHNADEKAIMALNSIASDADINSRMTREEAKATADALLRLADIHSCKDYARHKQYKNYGKAYTYNLRAINLATEYGLTDMLAKAYLELARKYDIHATASPDGNFNDTVVSTLRKSIDLAVKAKDWKTVDDAMFNLANATFPLGKGRAISDDLQRYYTLHRDDAGNAESKAPFVKSYCRAMQKLADDSIPAAYEETLKAERYAAGDSKKRINVLSLRAQVLFMTGDFSQAMALLDTVSAISATLDNEWIAMQIELSKSNVYESLGMTQKADSCKYLYYNAKEKVLEDEGASKIRDYHFMSRIDESNLRLHKMAIQKKQAHTLVIILLIVMAVFIVMLTLIIRTNRKLRESYRRIYTEYSSRLDRNSSDLSNLPGLPTIGDETAADGEPSPETHQDKKYKGSELTREQMAGILDKIRTVINDSDVAFGPRFQIKDLASSTGLSQRVISQTINEMCGCNFATFLAEHRIRTACRRITNSPDFRKLTIEAMADSVGIQSRSYFSTTFKKIVGLSPSEYIRQASKQEA